MDCPFPFTNAAEFLHFCFTSWVAELMRAGRQIEHGLLLIKSEMMQLERKYTEMFHGKFPNGWFSIFIQEECMGENLTNYLRQKRKPSIRWNPNLTHIYINHHGGFLGEYPWLIQLLRKWPLSMSLGLNKGSFSIEMFAELHSQLPGNKAPHIALDANRMTWILINVWDVVL